MHRWSVTLACCALLLSLHSVAPSALVGQTRIAIDAQKAGLPISSLIYGANHRFLHSGFGMWDPAGQRSFPKFDAVYDDIGFTSLRYPGGTLANLFRWKQAIGPVDKRGIQSVHGATRYLEPDRAVFGVDEWARWCERHYAELVYMYGIGYGSSDDAADLVEYMNAPVGTNPSGGVAWAEVRAANGHPRPYRLRYIEIGNEVNLGSDQKYWLNGTTDPLRAYAFGATASFEKQSVGLIDDQNDSASFSDGRPGQVKYVKYPPMDESDIRVYVGGELWSRVARLGGARREKIYEVDPQAGTIVFGDGAEGEIPPAGRQIVASYRTTRDGFTAYYRAIKAVDPNVRVFSCWDDEQFVQLMGNQHPYDGIVAHPYTWNVGNMLRGLSAGDHHDRVMQQPEIHAQRLQRLQTLMRARAGRVRGKKMSVICTEYGIGDRGPSGRYRSSLDQGLWAAQMLIHFMRMGMPLAHKHALIESFGQELIGPPPDFIQTAAARTFKMFTHLFGSRLVDVLLIDNPERKIFDGSTLTMLEAAASRDRQGRVCLMVVNRDREHDVAAAVEVRGASGTSLTIWTLNGPDFASYNTVEKPDTVRISEETRTMTGSSFKHRFPAHSITAIRVAR